MRIDDAIQERANQYPDNIALIHKSDKLTFQELLKQSDQLAAYLVQQGLKREDIVGIYCERGFNYIISLLGIVKAGGAVLSLDPHHPKKRHEYILSDTNPKYLLTEKHLEKQSLELECKTITLPVKQSNQKNTVSLVSQKRTDNDLAYVVYTSGSTGHPKGVLIEHKGIIAIIKNMSQIAEIKQKSRVLQLSALSFDAFLLEVFCSLYSGASLHLLSQDEFPPFKKLSDLVNEKEITHLIATPSAINTMKDSVMPSLKVLVSAGEALSPSLSNQLAARYKLVNAYGPSETTIVVSCSVCKVNSKVTIGRSIPNTNIYLIDDHHNLVGKGEKGEIAIGGSCVARGYLNLEEETQKRFIKTNFSDEILYKSGDYGKMDQDGNLEYIGRRDNQIKIRGFRVELSEIQSVIESYPQIDRSVVVAIGEGSNKRLVAYYLSNDPLQFKQCDLENYVNANLPNFMHPAYYISIEKIPLTHNGKIDINSLPQPSIKSDSVVKPKTEVEISLVEIWSQSLNVNKSDIGMKDSFFKLGGNSLTVTDMIFKVSEMFNKNINLIEFMGEPTLENLKGLIYNKNLTSGLDIAEKIYADINLVKQLNVLPVKNKDEPPKNVLLTGATGFLGAFLLKELLHNDCLVQCIVRADSEEQARKKLSDNYLRYFKKPLPSKAKVICADLSKKDLGLSHDQYMSLANEVDTIYHSAAFVNHLYSYEQLRPINVLGTITLLELANQGKGKSFHHISTVSAITDTDFSGKGVETFCSSFPKNYHCGYISTKWVIEQVMQKMKEKGMDLTVYRPGNITGESKDGITLPENNHALLWLKTCIQLKSAPNNQETLEMVPVDILAQAIISLSFNLVCRGSVYNLSNPKTICWVDYIKKVNSFGYKVKLMDENEWQKKKLKKINKRHALYPLIHLYRNKHENNIQEYSCEKTSIILKCLGLNFPSNYDFLIRKYLTWLESAKFFGSP